MSDAALVPDVGPDDHVSGPGSAPLTLVEYGDFECPYCAMAYPIVHAIRRELGDQLRVAFRHFPLKESHPHAQHAAEAAEAAAAQDAFWAMHDRLFENQHALEDADLVEHARRIGIDPGLVERALDDGTYTRRVRDNFRSGVRSGVNGTPTFFINGIRYDGAWSDEGAFLRALRDAR